MASTSRNKTTRVPSDLWSREFVRNPYLTQVRNGSRLQLQLPYFGTVINSNSGLLKVVDAFSVPAPLKMLREISPVEDEVVMFLVHSFILVPTDEIEWLARGLLFAADNPIGRPLSWYELNTRRTRGGIGVFRVPIDFAEESLFRGSDGAQKVRETLYYLSCESDETPAGELVDFDLRKSLPLESLELFDLGDIAFTPGRDGLGEVGHRISKVTRCLLSRGMFPIVLGGDHSLTYYVLKEVFATYGKVGVIHFDAHTDLYVNPHAELNDLNHANVFQFVRRLPELQILFQVGIRDIYVIPPDVVRVNDPRITYVSAFEARQKTAEEIFQSLPTNIPYYLSFDVDVLDPVYAPETGTPVTGGLDFYQALALLDYISKTFRLVGADFVEIGNSASPYHSAAQIVARYIVALTMNYCSSNQLDNHVFESRATPSP